MKRVITYDFVRGIAIIGVLLFHLLNEVFAVQEKAIENAVLNGGTTAAYWYVIAPVLIIFGSFNGMFVTISAGSNAVSIHKQWERLVEQKGVAKRDAAFKIFGSQLLRGALIWALGFLSEGVFGTWLQDLINVLKGASNNPVWQDLEGGLLFSNILYTIGISIVICSVIQLAYLSSGMHRKKISIILIFVAIACIALMPAVAIADQAWFGTNSFSDGVPLSAGEFWARMLLSGFMSRDTPLLPYFACAALGLMISIHINEKAVTPEFLQGILWLGLVFVGASIPLVVIKGPATGPLSTMFGFSINREISLFYMTFITGLELVCLAWLLYMIDFRRKTNLHLFLRATVFIRRFGVTTLTLWMLQYFMVFPILLIQFITGWPMVALYPGAPHGALQYAWQLDIVLVLIFLMWHGILLAWERVKFVGSFEWFTTKLMSRGSTSGDRLNIRGILYDVQREIEWVPGKRARAKAEQVAEQ
jgi:hypothetical protein